MVAFVRVVEAHSFSGAARRLRISKPTVSKHITDLERHLGTRLFNRTTRSLCLTEAGERLYRHCRNIVSEIEAAEAEILWHSKEPTGRLRVSAPTALGGRFMATLLAGLLTKYPQIEIDLGLSDQPLDLVGQGLDLGIRLLEREPAGSPAKRLASGARILCASPCYCERHGLPSAPRDLVEHRCLECAHLRKEGAWRFEGPHGYESVTVRERIAIDDCEALKAAVHEGLGIALMLPLLVEEDLNAGRLVNVLPHYRESCYSIFAVFPDDHPPAKVLAFVAQLELQLANGDLPDVMAAAKQKRL